MAAARGFHRAGTCGLGVDFAVWWWTATHVSQMHVSAGRTVPVLSNGRQFGAARPGRTPGVEQMTATPEQLSPLGAVAVKPIYR